MKKRLVCIFLLPFIVCGVIFSQNLPSDRMTYYIEFVNFSNDFNQWYTNLCITREPDYYNAKTGTERNNFAQSIIRRCGAAMESVNTYFRNNAYKADFKGKIKTLVEQLNTKETSILNEWLAILNENGYISTNYNNIEKFMYCLQFLTNSCMLYDQEFPNNTITSSIVEKTKSNMNEIRGQNQSRAPQKTPEKRAK